jgi:hypothetical protein
MHDRPRTVRFGGSAGSVQQRAGTIKGQVPVDTRGWYVLVTSSSGKNVFAMLGPYATQESAERKARVSRVVHYRVELVTSTAHRYVRSRLAGSAHPLAHPFGGAP